MLILDYMQEHANARQIPGFAGNNLWTDLRTETHEREVNLNPEMQIKAPAVTNYASLQRQLWEAAA